MAFSPGAKERRVSLSIRPLIMCGGAGTRLWPISRESLPKQFAILIGDRSTFQTTVSALRGALFHARPLIVTNRAYRFLVERQLAQIGVDAEIVLEPCRRESGPAMLAGCIAGDRDADDGLILAMAADQLIADVEAFHAAVRAARVAAREGQIVTFGIAPTHPATEYGYIGIGAPIADAVHRVCRFTEKPDAARAAELVQAGYLWNSGNLLFSSQTLQQEYRCHAPGTLKAVQRSVRDGKREAGALALDAKAFAQAEARSIDFAIMERTTRAAVVSLSCGWSDVGNWNALWSLSGQDAAENVRRGDVELLDSRGCFVSSDGPLTSVLGVSDLIVVANRDAILVADRHRSAEVKQVVDALRRKGRPEADTHQRVYRPWGWYQVLDSGDGHLVKRIVVQPNGRLSLQKHQFRAEHWIVVNGAATVTVGSSARTVYANEHVHIPLGAVHRLENFGNSPLELIEVQSGSYIGEDDIVRLEDAYHRA